MHQAQVSQRRAFEHVVAHHSLDSLELLMSDEELGQSLLSMTEEVPAPRITVGMMYPPTKRWSTQETCLEYLQILAYLSASDYAKEITSATFKVLMMQFRDEFSNVLDLAGEFDLTLPTVADAIKLLTFLTGEVHPEPKFSFEGVAWPVVDVPNYDPNAPTWVIVDQRQ